MKRIDNRTVEFNHLELCIKEKFEDLLDQGQSITNAAINALPTRSDGTVPTELRDLSPAFVRYLSDNTVRLDSQTGRLSVVVPS